MVFITIYHFFQETGSNYVFVFINHDHGLIVSEPPLPMNKWTQLKHIETPIKFFLIK